MPLSHVHIIANAYSRPSPRDINPVTPLVQRGDVSCPYNRKSSKPRASREEAYQVEGEERDNSCRGPGYISVKEATAWRDDSEIQRKRSKFRGESG